MIQTKYFCDLCGEELEALKSGNEVKQNIILTIESQSQPKQEYHGCQDCIESLNPYEIISELLSNASQAPPFKADVQSITVTLCKLKRVSSIGDNCKEKKE